MIQELKNHLQQVLRFSDSSLLRTKQEAEKQQKADFRASQARVAKIQQELLLLRSQFHSLVMENREAEQALRKVPGAAGGRGQWSRQGRGGGGGRFSPRQACSSTQGNVPEEEGAGPSKGPAACTRPSGRVLGAHRRPAASPATRPETLAL